MAAPQLRAEFTPAREDLCFVPGRTTRDTGMAVDCRPGAVEISPESAPDQPGRSLSNSATSRESPARSSGWLIPAVAFSASST